MPFFAWAVPPPEPAAVERASPEAMDALLRQAKGLRYARRWYEATALYRRALADYGASPRVHEARFWLAATLEQDQRWDEAADAYTDFLRLHPDQRILVKEAKLNRIHCWGLRQGQNPQAVPGLLEALNDESAEVQVAAGLERAKQGDPRAAEALQKGLRDPATADACRLALAGLGIKPNFEGTRAEGRFLVIRVRRKGQEEVRVRVAIALARAVGGYLSDAQLSQARHKGVDLERLMDQALGSPRGTVLFSVEDAEGIVTVQVE